MTPPKAAFLRTLPSHGFVPPPDAAFDMPTGANAPARRFAVEVEAFAAAFWALAPSDRRDRFNALWNRRCGPVAARLAELRSGLDVTEMLFADPRADEVARLVRDLFPLPTRDRASRRAQWLAGIGPDRESWVAAARAVAFGDPLGARLDPHLFARLDIVLLPLPPGLTVPPRPAVIRNMAAEAERDARNAWFLTRLGVAACVLLLLLSAVAVVGSCVPALRPRYRAELPGREPGRPAWYDPAHPTRR